MNIVIICKDIGEYVHKLSQYLERSHRVCFIDTASSAQRFNWAPKKLRKPLRAWAETRQLKNALHQVGRFDVALLITPAQLDAKLIKRACAHAERKIAYLYDSLSRWPMSAQEMGAYDKVFSFDQRDAQRHGLQKFYNYIYEDLSVSDEPTLHTASVVMSGQERIPVLEGLAREFDRLGVSDCRFLVQSKPVPGTHPAITYFRERMPLATAGALLRNSKIVIDIARPGQTGLSFRFFEAMPLRKKVITNNASVADYDFYNPANILIIDEHAPVIPAEFLAKPYVDIPAQLFEKYSLAGWTRALLAEH